MASTDEVKDEEAISIGEVDQNEKVEIWKKYEDGYIVRTMRPSEARITMKWNDNYVISKHDLPITLEIFSSLKPGFYVGEYNGKVVASATRLNWGNGIYYGSYYYVAKEFRSRGFGTRLRDDVAFSHVGKNILCIDAVTGKVSEKNAKLFGYKHKFVSERYQGTAKEVYELSDQTNIVTAGSIDFEKLIQYDNKLFISRDNPQRRELLKRFIQLEDSGSYVAMDKNENIVGCAFQRPAFQDGHVAVGPLYAESTEIAENLLKRLLMDVPEKEYTLNIYKPNEGAQSLVKNFDMRFVCEFNRMHANGDANDLKDGVYAVTSVELCGF